MRMEVWQRLRSVFVAGREPRLPADADKAERGRFGEALAARFVRRRLGGRVIARNWRSARDRRDELDLVFRKGEVLVFVEVRTRSAEALVSGFHSVNRHKKEVLRRSCKSYLSQLQTPPKHFRFDIIDVALFPDGRGEVRHYANVPLFAKHFTAAYSQP